MILKACLPAIARFGERLCTFWCSLWRIILLDLTLVIDDRTHASVIEDKRIDINKLKKEEMRELLRELFSDKISTTVIDENKPARNGDHPTMKPLKLLARLTSSPFAMRANSAA